MGRVLIIISGIYLTLLSTIVAGLELLLFFAQKDGFLEPSLFWPMFIAYGVIMVLLLFVSIGIFRKKNWARITLLIFSGIAITGGIMACISATMVSQMNIPDRPKIPAETMIAGGIFLVIFFVIIPAGFIMLFNSRQGKEWFAAPPASPKTSPQRPLPITILTFYYGFSVLGLFVFLQGPGMVAWISHYPVGNFILPPAPSIAVFLLHIVVSVILAYGLFKSTSWAWRLLVIFCAWQILSMLTNYLFMSWETTDKLLAYFATSVPKDLPLMTGRQMRLGYLTSSLIPGIILLYALFNKKRFLEKGHNT